MHDFMIQPGKFENSDKPEARYFILVSSHQPGSAICFGWASPLEIAGFVVEEDTVFGGAGNGQGIDD